MSNQLQRIGRTVQALLRWTDQSTDARLIRWTRPLTRMLRKQPLAMSSRSVQAASEKLPQISQFSSVSGSFPCMTTQKDSVDMSVSAERLFLIRNLCADEAGSIKPIGASACRRRSVKSSTRRSAAATPERRALRTKLSILARSFSRHGKLRGCVVVAKAPLACSNGVPCVALGISPAAKPQSVPP